jgi:hypothetical protein
MDALRTIAADSANPNQLAAMEHAIKPWAMQTRDRTEQQRRLQALNYEIAHKVGQFWDDTRAFIREGLPEDD